jgi:hypothetical protein
MSYKPSNISIDSFYPNTEATFNMGNGHTILSGLSDMTYEWTVDSSNNLNLTGQASGPSPAIQPISIDQYGAVLIPSLTVPGGDVLSLTSNIGSGIDLVGTSNIVVSSALVAGTNITLTPSLIDNSISISASGGGGSTVDISSNIGSGIDVDNTNPLAPILSSNLVAGANITLTPSLIDNSISISASGGGGGGSVNSVIGGNNISISGTSTDPIIDLSTNVVLSVVGGNAISISGTSQNPIIDLSLNPVLSITAGTGPITITGTSANPVLNVGSYTAGIANIWQYTSAATTYAGGGASMGNPMLWQNCTFCDPMASLTNANSFSAPDTFTAPLSGLYRLNLGMNQSSGGLDMLVWNMTQNPTADLTKMILFKNNIQGAQCIAQFVGGDFFNISAGGGSGAFASNGISILTVEFLGKANPIDAGTSIVFGPFSDTHAPTLIGSFIIPADYQAGSNATIQWNYQASGLVSGFTYTLGLWVGGVDVGTLISSQAYVFGGGSVQPTPYNSTANNINIYFTYAFTAGQTIEVSYEGSGTGSHVDTGTVLISPFFYSK